MSTHGKWIASHSEECWTDSNEFDTREQAIAYAVSELAPGHEVKRVYTGQIEEVSMRDLADAGVSAWSVIDSLSCWLHDNVGDEVDYELDVPDEAEADLDKRLTETIHAWMLAHGIKPNCFRIEAVKSHDVPQAAP